jgi:preprotein translocase subunit SecB
MEKKNNENSKYKIIANYIKDLSFEIPSPDCFIDAAQNLDKYETKVDISNKPLKNGMLELNCKLIFEAPKEVQNKIHAEACLAVVFKITDTELKTEEIKKIILAEIPDLYAKKLTDLITELFQKSGFKEFKFKKEINFKELYGKEIYKQQSVNLTQKH